MATVSCLIPAPLQSLFGRQLPVTVYRVPLWYGSLYGFACFFACYCSSLWIAVYEWTLSAHLCSSFYYVVSPAWLILIILGSLFPLLLFFFLFRGSYCPLPCIWFCTCCFNSMITFDLNTYLHSDKQKKELSIYQSLLCLDLVCFPVLSQIKPQAPLLVVPFHQFL